MRQKIEDEQNNGRNLSPGTTFTPRRLQRWDGKKRWRWSYSISKWERANIGFCYILMEVIYPCFQLAHTTLIYVFTLIWSDPTNIYVRCWPWHQLSSLEWESQILTQGSQPNVISHVSLSVSVSTLSPLRWLMRSTATNLLACWAMTLETSNVRIKQNFNCVFTP